MIRLKRETSMGERLILMGSVLMGGFRLNWDGCLQHFAERHGAKVEAGSGSWAARYDRAKTYCFCRV
jgi:hypothetical protein